MKMEVFYGDVNGHKVMLTFAKLKKDFKDKEVDMYELYVYVDNKECFDWCDFTDYSSKLQSYEIICKMLYDANRSAIMSLNQEPYSVSYFTIDTWLRQNEISELLLDAFGWRDDCTDGELFNELMTKTIIEI